jgi:hypothetical protein
VTVTEILMIHTRILSPSGLLTLVLSSLSLSSVAAAPAPCSYWDPHSLREIVQDNGPDVSVNLHATRAGVEGTAAFSTVSRGNGESVGSGVDGGIKGTLNRTQLHLQILWSNGPVGIYDGHITRDGHVQGTTFDHAHPDKRVGWHSPRPLQCAK